MIPGAHGWPADPSAWLAWPRRRLVVIFGAAVLGVGVAWQWPSWPPWPQADNPVALRTELARIERQLAQEQARADAIEIELGPGQRRRRRWTPLSWLPELQHRAAGSGVRVELLQPLDEPALEQAVRFDIALRGGTPQLLQFLDAVQAELDGLRIEQQQLDALDAGELGLRGRWSLLLGDDDGVDAAAGDDGGDVVAQRPRATSVPRLAASMRVGERAELVLQQGEHWLHSPCHAAATAAARAACARSGSAPAR